MDNKFCESHSENGNKAPAEGTKMVAEMVCFSERHQLAQQMMVRRRELRLSQAELSRISRIEQAEIGQIERGRSNPTLETLAALARALGCELDFAPVRRHSGKQDVSDWERAKD